jgi:hydrogenase expression/formation protein HypE
MTDERILLIHGSGGESTRQLIQQRLLPACGNEWLNPLTDAAVLPLLQGRPVFTTDGYVVSPPFFPGGDIGMLSVIGTCNDLAMMGAIPRWLSLSFILEESLPLERFDKILTSIRSAADEAGVQIVTGDTKVVERGKADQIFITTAGVGELLLPAPLQPSRIQPGDAILLSNDIGRHGMAVLARREGIQLDLDLQSDVALLSPLIQALVQQGIELHCARDLTRGGLGGALLELATQSGCGFQVNEVDIPVVPAVAAACEWLGFDPLFVANEGCCVLFVPASQASAASEVLQQFHAGRWATRIGTVTEACKDVRLKNAFGIQRPLSWHTVDQLPRIC